MEGDNILVGHIVECCVHLIFERREFFDIGSGVFLVFVGMCGIGFLQLIGNVAHLSNFVGHAEPDMGVIALIIVNEFNAA